MDWRRTSADAAVNCIVHMRDLWSAIVRRVVSLVKNQRSMEIGLEWVTTMAVLWSNVVCIRCGAYLDSGDRMLSLQI